MYFPDMTPYTYLTPGQRDEGCPVGSALNVGWLSRDYPFPNGKVSEGIVNVLQELVSHPMNLCRGIHLCEFCPVPEKSKEHPGFIVSQSLKGKTGNGEIWVSNGEGIVYVAPVLILHYITEHGYVPPSDFVNALERIARDPGRPSGRQTKLT